VTKRVRGPVRTQRRPGTRAASDRAAVARRRPQTSQLEAAEVIAEDVVEEHPADAAHELERVARTVPTRAGLRTKPGSLLATRAATEYVYVSLDMRRILLVAAALFGTLIVLWLLLVVMKVVALPFY
jgi:Flp pilus assembly protein TadB